MLQVESAEILAIAYFHWAKDKELLVMKFCNQTQGNSQMNQGIVGDIQDVQVDET